MYARELCHPIERTPDAHIDCQRLPPKNVETAFFAALPAHPKDGTAYQPLNVWIVRCIDIFKYALECSKRDFQSQWRRGYTVDAGWITRRAALAPAILFRHNQGAFFGDDDGVLEMG